MLLPTLGLVFLLVLFFAEARLLAGRSTLALRHYAAAFGVGCILVGVAEVVVERALQWRWDGSSFSYTAGPVVEELGKALPVLVLAFGTRIGRRLSVVDFALVGFATGLGVEFVEENFRVLTVGSLSTGVTQVFPLLPGVRSAVDGHIVDASHPVWTALVGLAVGLGVRLWPRDLRRFLPAAVALAWVVIDHAAYNWQVTVESPDGSSVLADPARPVAIVSALSLHGKLELIALPVLLVAAGWLETRWCWDTVGEPSLLLDHERQPPLVAMEWQTVLSRVADGARPVRDMLDFFRQRHAFLVADAARDDRVADPELEEWTRRARLRLARRRRQVDDLNVVATGWSPPEGWWRRPSVLFTLGYLALLALLFGVALPSAPQNLSKATYSAPVALVLAVLGFAYALWQLNLLRAQPPLDPAHADGSALVDRRLRVLLVLASVGSGALALLGWFIPTLLLAGAPGGVSHQGGARNPWAGGGGNPDSLLGAGAAAPRPKVKDKCKDQQRWVAEGLRRLAAKQREIDYYTHLQEQTAARGQATGADVTSDVYTLGMLIRGARWEKAQIEHGQRERERWLAECLARPPHDPLGDPPPADIEVGGDWTPPGHRRHRGKHPKGKRPTTPHHKPKPTHRPRRKPAPPVVDGRRKPPWWPGVRGPRASGQPGSGPWAHPGTHPGQPAAGPWAHPGTHPGPPAANPWAHPATHPGPPAVNPWAHPATHPGPPAAGPWAHPGAATPPHAPTHPAHAGAGLPPHPGLGAPHGQPGAHQPHPPPPHLPHPPAHTQAGHGGHPGGAPGWSPPTPAHHAPAPPSEPSPIPPGAAQGGAAGPWQPPPAAASPLPPGYALPPGAPPPPGYAAPAPAASAPAAPLPQGYQLPPGAPPPPGFAVLSAAPMTQAPLPPPPAGLPPAEDSPEPSPPP